MAELPLFLKDAAKQHIAFELKENLRRLIGEPVDITLIDDYGMAEVAIKIHNAHQERQYCPSEASDTIFTAAVSALKAIKRTNFEKIDKIKCNLPSKYAEFKSKVKKRLIIQKQIPNRLIDKALQLLCSFVFEWTELESEIDEMMELPTALIRSKEHENKNVKRSDIFSRQVYFCVLIVVAKKYLAFVIREYFCQLLLYPAHKIPTDEYGMMEVVINVWKAHVGRQSLFPEATTECFGHFTSAITALNILKGSDFSSIDKLKINFPGECAQFKSKLQQGIGSRTDFLQRVDDTDDLLKLLCTLAFEWNTLELKVKVMTESSNEDKNVNPKGLKPGIAYVINHLNFNDSKLKKRTGSEMDIQRLQVIFRKFQMKVNIVSDGTLADVRAVMEKISTDDFQNRSCVVIVIMSHGFEGNKVAAKDGIYSLDYDIMYHLLRNSSLTAKLKLLVTQSCKGPVNPLLEIEGPRPRPSAIPSEILQINSCVEGYVSYLSRSNGSVFIATLCNHLENSGLTTDILSIANQVVADVKQQYLDIQIPMVHTNLTQKFVFGHYIKNCAEAELDANCSSDEDRDVM